MSKAFRKALIPLSLTDDPDVVLEEWTSITHVPRDDDLITHCICGVKITYVFEIFNETTGNAASVGCVCIKRVGKPEWVNFANDALYEEKHGIKPVRCVACDKRIANREYDGTPQMHKSCARRRRVIKCRYCREPVLEGVSHIACDLALEREATIRLTLPFGKYKHERIYDVLKTPRGIRYCAWLKTCNWVSDGLKQGIKDISSILYLELKKP